MKLKPITSMVKRMDIPIHSKWQMCQNHWFYPVPTKSKLGTDCRLSREEETHFQWVPHTVWLKTIVLWKESLASWPHINASQACAGFWPQMTKTISSLSMVWVSSKEELELRDCCWMKLFVPSKIFTTSTKMPESECCRWSCWIEHAQKQLET